MSGDGADAFRYGEENGIVLDKWIFDVCGADGLQFPAHRRRQFPAYLTHAAFVAKQKEFVAATFAYPSRVGAREALVLQYTLDALGNREKTYLRQLHAVEGHIAHVKEALEERTMGMSELAPSVAASRVMSRVPTPAPASVPARPRPVEDGYAPLVAQPSSAVASLPSRGEDRRSRYAEKKNIAARYVEHKQREIKDTEAAQQAMVERYEKLKVEEDQLRKECRALKDTEDIVLARQAETEQRLMELRARVEQEQAAAAARPAAHTARLAKAVAAILSAPPVVGTPVTDAPTLSEDSEDLPHSLDAIDVSEETEPVPGEDGQGGHDAALDAILSSSSPDSSLRDHAAGDHDPRAPAVETHAQVDAAGTDEATEVPQHLPHAAETTPESTEAARVVLLERLRHELSASGARQQELVRTLRNESQIHVGRLRQSRQRLRDWQDIVESQRRVAEQLEGQVSVLTEVVKDTTARLGAADVANRGGEAGGYMGHLARLNELLKQRTVEQYQAYVGSTTGSAAEAATDAEEEMTRLRPIARPGPGASGFNTPARRGSSTGASDGHTPTRATGGHSPGEGGGVHRSRYDLVRHLLRWERALLEDRARLRRAVGLNGNTGASESTVGRRDSYNQLRAMLFQA